MNLPTKLGIASLLISVGVGVTAQHPTTAAAPSLVDRMDALVQPRFQDDTAGTFGTARLGIPGHEVVIDKRVHDTFLEQVKAVTRGSKNEYTLGFLHFVKTPGKPKQKDFALTEVPQKPEYWLFYLVRQGKIFDNGSDGAASVPAAAWEKQFGKRVETVCLQNLSAVKRGASARISTKTLQVFVRPITASKASCLGCHAGTTKGQALGAMVYTIGAASPLRQTTAPPPRP